MRGFLLCVVLCLVAFLVSSQVQAGPLGLIDRSPCADGQCGVVVEAAKKIEVKVEAIVKPKAPDQAKAKKPEQVKPDQVKAKVKRRPLKKLFRR